MAALPLREPTSLVPTSGSSSLLFPVLSTSFSQAAAASQGGCLQPHSLKEVPGHSLTYLPASFPSKPSLPSEMMLLASLFTYSLSLCPKAKICLLCSGTGPEHSTQGLTHSRVSGNTAEMNAQTKIQKSSAVALISSYNSPGLLSTCCVQIVVLLFHARGG